MVHQWGFFGSISAIRKIWSLTANSRSLQAAALKGHADLLPKLKPVLRLFGPSHNYFFQLKFRNESGKLRHATFDSVILAMLIKLL